MSSGKQHRRTLFAYVVSINSSYLQLAGAVVQEEVLKATSDQQKRIKMRYFVFTVSGLIPTCNTRQVRFPT